MHREHPARSSGYTLLEVLVLLVISGIIVAVMFQALLGQTGFARLTVAREEVQQNAWTSMELISSELRTITPRAVRVAARDSIVFRLPRAWGALCQPIGLVMPGTGIQVIARFPPGTVPDDFGPNRPAWGIGVGQGTDPAAVPAIYGYFLPTATLASGSTCDASLGAAPGTVELGVAATSLPGLATPFTADVGMRAYIYEEVGYRAVGGRIDRVMGYSPGLEPNWKELTGPLTPQDGLVFQYFRVDGTEITANPVPPALLPTVASIRISIRTQSTGTFAADTRQGNSVSTVVFLRNR